MNPKFHYWIAVKRYRVAYFWHAVRDPTMSKIMTNPFFSRSIGATREERNKNIELMDDRWMARGPKPRNYGLPADTAPSKEIEKKMNEIRGA